MTKIKKIIKLTILCIKKPSTIFKGISYLFHNGPSKFLNNMKGRASDTRMFVDEPICFSIVMPVYKVDLLWLDKAIASIERQTYKNWELCIADDCSQDSAIKGYLDSKQSEKIKITYLQENGGISVASNEAAKLATGDYILLMDNDDEIAETALEKFYACIQSTNADIIYSDHDIIDIHGNHSSPLLKPDWSYDLFLAQMYMGHLLGFRKELFFTVGGFRSEFNGSQDYDLLLRMIEHTKNIQHISSVLYSWRAIPSSTAANPESKPYAQTAGQNAIYHHLNKTLGEGKADVWESENYFVYDVRYPLKKQPFVSIIIPIKDHVDLLETAINSILHKTTYAHYEILILNNCSEEYETYEYLEKLENDHKNIRVVKAFCEFNWSKINNIGIQEALGEVYIFLNNDVEVISEDWMERLVENAVREDIGVVGAQLLYEDDTLQHAGVVVGIGGWADHLFKGMPAIHKGTPFISPMVTRNVSAVTGACMAISKRTIEKIGGFDEEFIICGSDIEICLKAIDHGLRNLYLPKVRLYHYESKSRDSFIPEVDFKKSYAMYDKYRHVGDPYYNSQLDYNYTTPTIDPVKLPGYPSEHVEVVPEIEEAIKQNLPHIDTNIYEITPYTFCKSTYPRKRINLLVPSINTEHVFGGISTAIKFFDELCSTSGYDKRMILTDAAPNEAAIHCYSENGYTFMSTDIDSDVDKQILPYHDRVQKSIPVSEQDIFVFTGWWTAHCCQEAYDQFEWKPNKFIYFIQDFEPGFYSWSSRYLLADATYRNQYDHIAIFNSGLLYEYFKKNEYNFYKEFSFEPVLNKGLKTVLDENLGEIKKQKQIILYGRPGTERNAFSLIIRILKKWAELYPNAKDWKIVSAGEIHETVHIQDEIYVESVGKLSIDEYAHLLLDSYAGISLMASPHPSYPPLEMATFGVHVITNTFGNKDLKDFDSHILSLDNISPIHAAKQLISLCDEYSEKQILEIENISYCENEHVFNFIDEVISSL